MSRILFVDDDAAMRILMKRVLSFDFEVEVAESGSAALQILESDPEPFAVLLADMTMANGDGLQLMAHARRLAPQTTRILLSGDYRLSLDPSFAHTAGLFKVLSKPADNPTILAALRDGVEQYMMATSGLAAA